MVIPGHRKVARGGPANLSGMQDTRARAARILGVDDPTDPAAVRRAFRSALRRERPDLGGMSAERLSRLMAARDMLLAASPAPGRPPSPRRPVPAGRPGGQSWSGPTGPHASRFDVAAVAATGRVVDVYA